MFTRGKKIDQILGIVLRNAQEVSGRNDIIEILREENKELRTQNRELLDRLMARDFEQLKLYEPIATQDQFVTLDPMTSEGLAGEILEGTDQQG